MRYSTLLYHYSTQATIIFLSSRRCAPLRTASSALGIELSVFSWWLLAEPPPPPPELPAFRHEACHSAAEPWPGRAGVVPDLPRGGINAPEPDPDDEEAIYTWEVWRPRPLWAAAPAYEAPEFLMHGHGGVPIPCWRELVTLRVRERLRGTPGPTEFDRLWRSVWGRLSLQLDYDRVDGPRARRRRRAARRGLPPRPRLRSFAPRPPDFIVSPAGHTQPRGDARTRPCRRPSQTTSTSRHPYPPRPTLASGGQKYH